MEMKHISLCVVQSENKASFPTPSLVPVCKDKCQHQNQYTGHLEDKQNGKEQIHKFNKTDFIFDK